MSEWTQERLDSLVVEWQKLLRLQDWYFTVSISRHWELATEGRLGECSTNDTNRAAFIKLLDPRDHHDGLIPYDVEETLVHEMLHCYYGYSGDAAKDLLLEQGINATSKALVSLKRRAKVD